MEKNESKIIVDKKDYKMIRLENNNYLFEYEIINKNILLTNVINIEFIKLIYEINKNDIFEDFNIEYNNDNSLTIFVLFKHFFNDFGISQKYLHLDISIEEKNESQIIFTSITNNKIPEKIKPTQYFELIPISEIITTCNFINPHKVNIKTTLVFSRNMNLPDFIEKISTTIISKIFLRSKQFIEKITNI